MGDSGGSSLSEKGRDPSIQNVRESKLISSKRDAKLNQELQKAHESLGNNNADKPPRPEGTESMKTLLTQPSKGQLLHIDSQATLNQFFEKRTSNYTSLHF
jgi:hypothetical protein